MSYHARVYRERNAHSHDETKRQSFFSGESEIKKTSQNKPFFQGKLSVNQPGDSYEQEADSVASAVVNKTSNQPIVRQKKISSIQRLATTPEEEIPGTNDMRMERDKEKPFQRMSMDPEKEKKKGIQKMEDPMKEKEGKKKSLPAMQRKESNTATTSSPGLSSRVESSAGNGKSLPAKALNEMNHSFGLDFGNVNIHDNSDSANMNDELNAHAFTYGNDIYFNKGKFDTNSSEGKFLLAHELTHVVQQNDKTINPEKVQRQIAGGGGNSDPCFDLLQQIIELLNEVAKRINDALNDPHDLFKYHKKIQDADPDFGSWDGHRDRYYYDRDRLKEKLAEWESNDKCKGYPLTNEQKDELAEAAEFKDKEFPAKPAPSMRTATDEEPTLREKIAEALKNAGIPAWAVAGLIVLIIAAIADPEPFSKVVLLIGAAAAVIVFIAIGRSGDIPPRYTASASVAANDQQGETQDQSVTNELPDEDTSTTTEAQDDEQLSYA